MDARRRITNPMAATNSTIEGLTIEKLVYGGDGLAHHDGSTVFVPFVLPQERVAATVVEDKRKFVRARLERILSASPDRVAPQCLHFGDCGGCNYQHIAYECQLRHKNDILRETLRRIGGIHWGSDIQVLSAQPWCYRNRAQWKIRSLDNVAPEALAPSQPALGYLRANSASICPVHDCPILSPLLLRALLALRRGLSAHAPGVREFEAFVNASDTKLLLTATFSSFPSDPNRTVERLRAQLPEVESLLLHDPARDRMELFGPGFIEYETRAAKYRVGHFSFFQVNRFLVDALQEYVAGSAEGGRLALDLFAGVGLFSLPLANRFGRVIAVESNPAAARDLERNAGSHTPVEVRTEDVERFLEKCKEKPELVVLDPPRAGLMPAAVSRLAQLAPDRITYVSCDPATLARDLKALCRSGYEIAQIALFDLFPQTFHIETVARLARSR